MADVLIGVVAVIVGAFLCFRGYHALRVVIAVWGAFAGFLLGAGLVASSTGETFLSSVLAWVVGAAVALLFGLVAYLYYAVSVVIGMGAIGFALGTTLLVALGVTWSWVTVLGGVAAGVLLATLAIVGDLPRVILAVIGAFAGASVVVAGVLLVTDGLDGGELVVGATTQALELTGWWYAAYLVLAVVGLVVQLRDAEARRGTLRDAWARA